jgi:hypothetical protein
MLVYLLSVYSKLLQNIPKAYLRVLYDKEDVCILLYDKEMVFTLLYDKEKVCVLLYDKEKVHVYIFSHGSS